MPTIIRTNHHWRPFLYRTEVPDAVLASEFDWTDPGDDIDGFFRYRGAWYHLSEFLREDSIPGFHGFHGDSYFSGVAVAVSDDGERYKVATVYHVSD